MSGNDDRGDRGDRGDAGGEQRLGGFPLVREATAEALAERLAGDVAARLEQALGRRGRASLVVSGGGTPKPFFRHLSAAAIDWSGVVVTLADERWVAPGHPSSNETLVRETLLEGAAAAARLVGLYARTGTPEQGLDLIAEHLGEVPRPFDVVVLGMGGDGHTASLFPDAPELERGMDERERPVVAMHPPSVDEARVTLTRAALVDSEARFLHLVGEDKRHVLERALADEPRLAPIARVLDERPEGVAIYWSP